VSVLDDHIRETVNQLIQAARDECERNGAEAAEAATAEARREAEAQMAELRESTRVEAEEERARLGAEIDQARHEAQAVRDEIEGVRRDLEAAQSELDATRDNVEAALRDVESSRRDSDAVRLEVNRLSDVLRRKEERAAQAMRLPEAVRALDEVETFGEVLENLAMCAGREAGRAAVFLVKGDRLRDWRTVGFDRASDDPRLDISVNDSGLMAEAVQSGAGVGPDRWAEIPEFARADEARQAAAWPVSVGGSVVAVLYADGPIADKSDEPYWPAFLEVLARHAGRVLEGITVRQAAGLMTSKASGQSPSSVSRQSSGSIQ
jgi:chemotaxis protein histidine kinase CheA